MSIWMTVALVASMLRVKVWGLQEAGSSVSVFAAYRTCGMSSEVRRLFAGRTCRWTCPTFVTGAGAVKRKNSTVFFWNRNKEHLVPPVPLQFSLLNALYDQLLLLSWFKAWRDAVEYEVCHWVGNGIKNFVGWRDSEYFMVRPEESVDSPVNVFFWWKKHEHCRAFSVLTIPRFVYIYNTFLNHFSCW